MIMDATHPRRGAALIVVLIFCTLISSLAIVTTRAMLSGASAAGVFIDEMRADGLGRDAADLVAYQLQSDDPQARRGSSFTARLPLSEVSVDYVSEAARIDVNVAPPKLLAALFIAAGADRNIAADIAGRVERLRRSARARAPARPGASDASSSSPATGAAPAFVRTEQIIDAWGLPEALYRSVRPVLTVASKSAKVDPILADRLVVTALMDGDEDRARDFLERRSHGFSSADEALAQFPAATRSYAGFAPAQAVRAIARVTVARRFSRNYEFVMTVPEGPDAEPRILSWQPLVR